MDPMATFKNIDDIRQTLTDITAQLNDGVYKEQGLQDSLEETQAELQEFIDDYGDRGDEFLNYVIEWATSGHLEDVVYSIECGNYTSYESVAQFARDYIDNCGDRIPDWLANHIDWDAAGEELLCNSTYDVLDDILYIWD